MKRIKKLCMEDFEGFVFYSKTSNLVILKKSVLEENLGCYIIKNYKNICCF